jgi:hypothetical protein
VIAILNMKSRGWDGAMANTFVFLGTTAGLALLFFFTMIGSGIAVRDMSISFLVLEAELILFPVISLALVLWIVKGGIRKQIFRSVALSFVIASVVYVGIWALAIILALWSP